MNCIDKCDLNIWKGNWTRKHDSTGRTVQHATQNNNERYDEEQRKTS